MDIATILSAAILGFAAGRLNRQGYNHEAVIVALLALAVIILPLFNGAF